MQKLSHGPLIDAAPDAEFWLDGGHNAACAGTLAETLTRLPKRPTHLICGMLNTKDISGYLEPLAPHIASLTAVSIPDEVNTLPAPVTAQAAKDVGMNADEADSVMSAVRAILEKQSDARILICGSLYLAGVILREHG
jgi:dihydrofolate synthase/folylpolyglutamate synthase